MFCLEFGPGECCSLVVGVTVVNGRFYKTCGYFESFAVSGYFIIYIGIETRGAQGAAAHPKNLQLFFSDY